MKILNEFNVNKKLQKYIHSYKVFSLETKMIKEIKKNESMQILINTMSNFEININKKNFCIKENEIVLINAHEESLFLSVLEKNEFVLIDFKTAGLAYFFSEVLYELENEILILNKEEELKNILRHEMNLAKNLDNFLLKKFVSLKIPFPILKIVKILEESKGSYNIDDINACANIPRKIFDKMFKLYLGISLKTCAKIIKEKDLI